jgi:copper homeostasis protein (lipoprotein)
MLRHVIFSAAAISLCAASANAQVIPGTVNYRDPGPPPFGFDLEYDAAAIHPGRRYAVHARVVDRGRLLFTTTQSALVVTQGHSSEADLVMRQVASPAPADVPVRAEPVALPATPIDAARARLSVPGRRPSAPAMLASLPATFSGTLPCDDCPGTRVQLNLLAGDAFFIRMTDQRRGAAPREDLGSWSLSSDGRVLVLGGRDGVVHQFLLRDALSLRLLDAAGEAVSTSARNDLRKTARFQPLDLRLEMQGSYRVAGDVGLFTECSTGRTWTIADGGAAGVLEARYRQARSRDDDAVLMTVEGRISEGAGAGVMAAALTVEDVVGASADGTCADRFASAPLDRTRWELAGSGDGGAEPGQQAHLVFDAGSYAFSGASGCHHVVGRYDTDGEAIAMELGGTMKVCAASAAEAALDMAIRSARTYRAVGQQLYFFDDTGTVVARFRAAN